YLVDQASSCGQCQYAKRQESFGNLSQKARSCRIVLQFFSTWSVQINKAAEKVARTRVSSARRAVDFGKERTVAEPNHKTVDGEQKTIEGIVDRLPIGHRHPQPSVRTQNAANLG